MSSSKFFATEVVHTVRDPKKQNGCVNNGIFQSSTLVFDSYEDFIYADSIYNGSVKMNPRQKTYGRNGTETVFDCQEAIANLYGAYYSKMTSSGYSAILVAVNAFCSAGSHILASDGVYGPTRNLITNTLKRYGVEHTFFQPSASAEEVEKLIKPNTTVIYLESPSSLTFEIQDIAGIAKVAKKHNIRTILDNTFFTAYYFNPFKYGVDVVVEACTKYLSGHSDIMGGVIAFNEECSAAIAKSTREIGANLSPMSAYYILRGIRTLKVRLDAHKKAVDEVIASVKTHKRVKQILHPSQENLSGHSFYKEQATGYTSLFSIVLDTHYSQEKLSKFFNRMQLFAMGYSWGGYESLAIPFPQNLHNSRSFPLITEGNTAVRVYVGFEDPRDLIEDLTQSLDIL
jgi:cysteine-S-conjugate beta-lyase